MMKVSTTCPVCKKEFVFDMTVEQMAALQIGEKHVQDILPDFTPEDREMFISGFCPKCWDETFVEDEQEG
jgi:hypothetical protein